MSKKSDRAPRTLSPSEIRWTLENPEDVYESTLGIEATSIPLGQERALKALRMGLAINHRGYNTFVCGLAGTGRTRTLKRLVESLKPSCPLTDDFCYVHNFEESDRPVLLSLPRGRGPKFKEAVREMVKSFARQLKAVMGSDDAKQRRSRIEERYQKKSIGPAEEFKNKIEAAGFIIAQVKTANQVIPDLLYRNGEETVHVSEIDALVEAEKISADDADKIRQAYEGLASELTELISTQQEVRSEYLAAVADSDREAVSLLIEGLVRNLQRNFAGRDILSWSKTLKKSLLDNLAEFLEPEENGDGAPAEKTPIEEMSAFDVNVILSNRGEACPVVIENNPTYQNLFGAFDTYPVAPGTYSTDFRRIRGGALVKAQGGYLILNAEDLLRDKRIWEELTRCLRTSELVIQPPDAQSLMGVPRMIPEPMPLNLKVIVIGSHGLYGALLENDMDFGKLFKVKADFESTLENTSENRKRYVDVLVHIIREEKLRDFDRGALERILIESGRYAGNRKRLTTIFTPVADLMREADYLAAADGAKVVSCALVRKAIEEKRHRNNLFEEILNRQIEEGDVFIDTDGQRVAQINGLTVMGTLDHEFGKPARITCSIGVGKAGIVNVEREVEMTGSTFDKGLMILQGFMNGRYGQEHALTLSASISFEQSYSYIDGDSASTTEIYVLLSALTGLPLRQDLAVTGSVDQFGRVQPVGGVNEKIEGFFDTCVMMGLTGKQGAMIPDTNVSDLSLAERVVEAVEAGTFHIYPIENVDQGIELLTGVKAGKRLKSGKWARNTVNEAAQLSLDRLHKLANDSGD
ncbi:MAG: AAA family ATPase [Planctomycetota bacterium]